MAETASGARQGASAPAQARPSSLRGALWQLLGSTLSSCLRYRVTGLAAEAAFFAILSLPPLVFGLAGSIGYLAKQFKVTEVASFRDQVESAAARALTDETVADIITPTLDDVLGRGRFDVISLGFVLALWSGSRALNVFVDTITIMYGLGGRRGIVRTRALSFSLYVIALVLGVVVVPLVLAGPTLVGELLTSQTQWLGQLYWPTVLLLTIAFITTLYHLSVPVRTQWRYDIPGAVLTLSIWLGGSWVLRETLQGTVGGTSIYGPLAAPIAVLLWLFVLSIAVLIGAALNASFDRVFPADSTAGARLELVRQLRATALATRMREAGLDDSVPAWEDMSSAKTHELHSDLVDGHERANADREAREQGRQRTAREKSRAQGRRRP
jgi:membrane protein